MGKVETDDMIIGKLRKEITGQNKPKKPRAKRKKKDDEPTPPVVKEWIRL